MTAHELLTNNHACPMPVGALFEGRSRGGPSAIARPGTTLGELVDAVKGSHQGQNEGRMPRSAKLRKGIELWEKVQDKQ